MTGSSRLKSGLGLGGGIVCGKGLQGIGDGLVHGHRSAHRPCGLKIILAKLLARSPGDRYQSADEALADVSTFLYDRGFGPTTASLCNYLAILRNPQAEPADLARHTLRFLDWQQGVQGVMPPWEPTAATAAAVAAGENPARG